MPRPRLPPGHPTLPGAGATPPGPVPTGHGAPDAHGAAHEGGEGAHGVCPGHGPMDPPGHINWYQGLLGVDNEKAQSDKLVDRLLWRYENKKDECDPKNQPVPFLAVAINFSIFAYLLVRLAKKPMSEALVNRRKSIMSDIDNASKLRSEAEKRLDEYEDRFEHLEDQLELLTKEYAEQSKREKERILAEAEQQRERMRRDAEFRVEQELKEAQQQLLHQAVDNAVEAAEELIRKSVGARDLEASADAYLASLGAAYRETERAAAGGGSAGGRA
jgi:F-type H+-transporting ATPase subunit b